MSLLFVEGQKASLKVGQRAARIVGSTRMGGGGFGGGPGGGGGGQVNSITFENVGLMLGVTPQIRRDGLVVMAIDIEGSQRGPAEEGPVISEPADGEAIRAAPTETLTTQSTLSGTVKPAGRLSIAATTSRHVSSTSSVGTSKSTDGWR
jgi:type II secretory pathway component GspD/PulD (secretin)